MSSSCIQNSENNLPNRWYLAYGSNLSSKTFCGRRGIRPLAQTNVIVPSLELTFDLPGIPYWEPCFANVRRRKENDAGEKRPPVLIGVAYLVTADDWTRIMATEGGGMSYEEVVVECRRIPGPDGKTGRTIDEVVSEADAETLVQDDQNELILASTLLAPDSKRRLAPVQPSKRYIDIIRAGARENDMPASYIAYLDDAPYYHRTSLRQQVGASLFLVMWLPPLFVLFILQKPFTDPVTGRLPKWLRVPTEAATSAMWQNYGSVWKRIFGSGEITAGRGASEAENCKYEKKREASERAPTDVPSSHIGPYPP